MKGSDRRRALLSTERQSNSCHVDYSDMKPVHMMSGVSEDQTPQSQSKGMQAKGLQSIPQMETNGNASHEDSTSNEIASLPHFRVLASHYQQ